MIKNQQETIEKLTDRLGKLLHLLYGAKSEKRTSTLEVVAKQTKPLIADQENPEINARNGRLPLPPDLPRVHIEYDLQGEQHYCSCGL